MAEEIESIIAELVDTFGESTGTLTQDGTDYPFTGAVMTGRRRTPGENKKDVERASLLVPASGLSVSPHRDTRLALTGSSTAWAVEEAQPIAPGNTVAGWRLSLVTWTGI